MILRVNEYDDLVPVIRVLNKSFGTVAVEFGLTKENCPSNSAFIDVETLKSQFNENREFYKESDENTCVGFVGIEKSLREKGTFYIEKLAVSPEYRHRGIGKKLIDFAENRITALGGIRASIAIIYDNILLRKWYLSTGYSETLIKEFAHLPFKKVCFMEKLL